MADLFLKVNKHLFNQGFNPLEMLLLSQIIEFQNNGKECYLTDDALAEAFGVSNKTVSRTLKKLDEEMHLIHRRTISNGSKKVRTMTCDVKALTQHVRDRQFVPDGQNDPGETDNLSLRDGQNDPIKDNIKDNIKDKTPNDLIAAAQRKLDNGETLTPEEAFLVGFDF